VCVSCVGACGGKCGFYLVVGLGDMGCMEGVW